MESKFTSVAAPDKVEERKSYTFVSKSYNPNPKKKGRYYPNSEIIPPVDEVYVRWEDENGVTQEGRRLIRYVPGERSIFADEQSEQANDKRRWGRIKLRDGAIVVGAKEITLLQFLRTSDMCGTKENRDESKNILYRENVPGKAAREYLEDEKSEVERLYKVHNMNRDELVAYAMVLGVRYEDKLTEDLKADILVMAKRNPAQFDAVKTTKNNKVMYQLQKAIDYGVINVGTDSVFWKSGKEIVTAPLSEEPLNFLAKYISETEDGQVIYDEIMRIINPEVGDTVEDAEKVYEEVEMSAKDLLQAGIDSGIITKTGKWYSEKDSVKGDPHYNFAYGATAAIKYVSDNENDIIDLIEDNIS
jgi:hypothetical protein